MGPDNFMADAAGVAARLLMGGAFVFAGLRNIVLRLRLVILIGGRGVPLPAVILWMGIVWQIVAGTMVLCGIQVALASAMLLAFLLVATPMFHNFWDYQGPDRASRINSFIGNVALAGGLLALIGQA